MKTFEELEKYAKENYIPIARHAVVEYIVNTIKGNNYKSILEIGTAIAYTSIHIAQIPNVFLTTYEYDNSRFIIAKQNINDFNVEDKIRLINDNCLYFEDNTTYDLMFIDGAKKHTIEIYEKYKNKLNKGGTIIIDNIDLKVTNQIESEKKKIKYQHIAEETKEYFENVKDFSVTYLDIGDGLIILK